MPDYSKTPIQNDMNAGIQKMIDYLETMKSDIHYFKKARDMNEVAKQAIEYSDYWTHRLYDLME